MPIWAVHAPQGRLDTPEAAEQAVFVREGFDKGAFLLGPLWLISHRLWRALIGWALVSAAILAATLYFRLPLPLVSALGFLVALWLGLEASALRAAALRRRGFALIDIAASEDEASGERAVFARWREAGSAPTAAAPRAPAPPVAPAPPAASARTAAPVLGLFPEPGGRA